MLYRALLLALATVRGWNDCTFPDVGYFVLDESVGLSYAYANAAMNGKLYSGGYTKGNFAFVGVTDGADVNPVPSATLWGDTTSDTQNLYVAEVSSSGSMTKGWHFKGSAIQEGEIGHGPQTNSIDPSSGLKAMLDKTHVVVKGGFKQKLSLPDGTMWSSAKRSDGSVRLNTNDQAAFLMKLDVSSTLGVGAGTTGWARMMDEKLDGSTLHAGGVSINSADGDTNGDMIVSYTGYAGYNASATYRDGYGRVRCCGAKLDGVPYVAKLSKTDGSEVWKHSVPHALSQCRTISDGSFFCGFTMETSDGALDFGNGVMVPMVTARMAVVIKFGGDGRAVWAKATHEGTFGGMGVSANGELLAIQGSSAVIRNSTGSVVASGLAHVTRIDTSSGNEGNMMWTDNGGDEGTGTHGFRGIEVTDDGSEVIVFGQHTGTMTLTDTTGSETTLRSRGSYEVFVATYDATDGSGIWAVDGGGSGMEYFFAFSSDPDTHDVYIGGTSRSEFITWGEVKRKNVMFNSYSTSNNGASPVGSSKAFNVKIKSTTSLPECLDTCSADGQPKASDVKAGYCYIDRHCYKTGDFSPYPGADCMHCDNPTDVGSGVALGAGPMEWSGPDTTSHCFIGGKCVGDGEHKQVRSGRSMVDDPCLKCTVSANTGEYSAVAGCNLDMAAFSAGCYDETGSQTSSQESGTIKMVFV